MGAERLPLNPSKLNIKMNTISLQVRYNAKTLSHMCRAFGTNASQSCTVGGFICPFVHQDENGGWTMDKKCREILPSDWEALIQKNSG